MAEVEAPSPSPPLATWSHTGKRGRKTSRRAPEPQIHDIARFLLSLSSSSASTIGSGALDPEEETYGSREAQERRRKTATKPVARPHECSLCPRRFRTGRALGGHMKCHWERDMKGRVVKKKMRKISSLVSGSDLGLGFSLQPSSSPGLNRMPLPIGDDGGDERCCAEEMASPPSPLLLQ